ncbi:CMP-N-acetylneuraminate-beta-galactosamide-alpha-2,3-sialyltransferase 1-like [Notolabrus celidotus]|uniref:CMP-N-acetylneuraminate-beta-galactosamide- alpha-2,3-sialyltransferase 1-like n=1 Tax=Notolabrus celidotus TaxID=1203425 RepID=UPI00148F850A|nr:CMP-N-acetylneuraminate-beta-galactosamide-alpha-2,3-sialyltransferase 1-like [Notolabrus celidotus]
MPIRLTRITSRPVFYQLCTLCIGMLSLYSLTITYHSSFSGGCLKEVDSVFGEMVSTSPKPFLSKNDTVTEDVFKWWKPIQGSRENFTYFKMTVEKTFQMIPPSLEVMKPSPGRCRTCAVVGNSGNLKGSHYGSLIDHHDFVIRINRGVTKGFEEDVGTKTTHRVLYPESAPRVENTTCVLFFPFKIHDYEWLRTAMSPENVKSPRRIYKDKVMILSPAFMKYVYDVWLYKKDGYGSTGFMTVVLSLVLCDEVSVFGFGIDNDGNWSHYFERFKYNGLGTGLHSGKVEYSIYQRLHEEKKIQFFKGL